MLYFLKKELLFFISLFLLFILTFYNKNEIQNYISYIDFPTIRAMIGLLLITTALKESNIFDKIIKSFLLKIDNEQTLSFILIFSTLFLSMFITNDISLFIIVPLTLTLKKYIKNDISKFIIFEAIAVNVGSLLTPIGNPQNIFLFRNWGINFIDFIYLSFPLFLIKFFILTIFIFYTFPQKSLDIDQNKQQHIKVDKSLFFLSIFLFICFIISMELNLVRYILVFIILLYFFINKEIFKKFDYFLILTFILMFIDFRIIANLEIIQNFIKSFDLNSNFTIFNISIILSQIISNVPATIFISEFSNNYQFIAYGANLAGTGFLIGSMANIIALRFYDNSKIYIDFHKFSIPFFIFSYLLFTILFTTLKYF